MVSTRERESETNKYREANREGDTIALQFIELLCIGEMQCAGVRLSAGVCVSL